MAQSLEPPFVEIIIIYEFACIVLVSIQVSVLVLEVQQRSSKSYLQCFESWQIEFCLRIL